MAGLVSYPFARIAPDESGDLNANSAASTWASIKVLISFSRLLAELRFISSWAKYWDW